MTQTAMLDWMKFSGLPDFASINDGDFRSAFEQALKEAEEEIEAIAAVEELPTLENFCNLLSLLGRTLTVYARYFFCMRVHTAMN
ncbi:peptidyl-dipeptidase Dcp [Bartonella sp. JB15]|nr:peptidyl-dipeptidase Dcp [Bartonella sp. JB15]